MPGATGMFPRMQGCCQGCLGLQGWCRGCQRLSGLQVCSGSEERLRLAGIFEIGRGLRSGRDAPGCGDAPGWGMLRAMLRAAGMIRDVGCSGLGRVHGQGSGAGRAGGQGRGCGGSSRVARVELGCPLVHARLHDTEPWGWEGLGKAGKNRRGRQGAPPSPTSHSLPTSAFSGAPLFFQHSFFPHFFPTSHSPLAFHPFLATVLY